MARAKAFNPDEALEQALKQFQLTGYSGTNLDKLISAMDLSKSSLYSVWPDKQALYLQALTRYAENHQARVAAWAGQQEKTGFERIEELVNDVALADDLQAKLGCFLVNAVSELPLLEEAAQEVIRRSAQQVQLIIRQVITDGQADGSIVKGIAPQDLSVMVYNHLNGLRIAAKAGLDNSLRQDGSRALLGLLKG